MIRAVIVVIIFSSQTSLALKIATCRTACIYLFIFCSSAIIVIIITFSSQMRRRAVTVILFFEQSNVSVALKTDMH